MESQYTDLYTLQQELREGIEGLFPNKLWVKAEISSISVKANGHCYIDLMQSENGIVVAKARAVIWRSKYVILSRSFREATGSDLNAGMSVLFYVQLNFSELYGLSMVVDDVDADITLGENERKRRETIAKLEKEGLIDKQQELTLPELPYYLAVISARDAAGFGDFKRHLIENEYGFAFHIDLVEATMQGINAPSSIIDALELIQTAELRYDAILIMRGGGSNLDLACFDDYDLAFSIANCDIPVFTAIGHDKDTHVADMVAYMAVKTPTALADEFLSCYMSEDERIASYSTRLKLAFINKINAMSSQVELLSSRIKSADPRSIISRGYTLVTDEKGVVVKKASEIKAGDRLRVLFGDGSLNCEVIDKN